MRSHTPESSCPNCGKVLDAATHPGDAVPRPGDLTMCAVCGEFSEFGPDLGLLPLSKKSLEGIDLVQLQAMRRLWARWREHENLVNPPASPA